MLVVKHYMVLVGPCVVKLNISVIQTFNYSNICKRGSLRVKAQMEDSVNKNTVIDALHKTGVCRGVTRRKPLLKDCYKKPNSQSATSSKHVGEGEQVEWEQNGNFWPKSEICLCLGKLKLPSIPR